MECRREATIKALRSRVTPDTDGSTRLVLGGFLPQSFDALNHELQAVASPFCARDGLFYDCEEIGVVQLFSKLFDKGMNLCVDQEEFATESRLQK